LELIEEMTTLLLADFESDWQAEAKARHPQFNMIHADITVEGGRRLPAVILNNVVGNAVRHTIYGRVSVDFAADGPCRGHRAAHKAPNLNSRSR
jgi:signal transduction histidine kinase